MRLGIVSDTHGHVGNARAAVAQLHDEQVDIVIHCGDIGSVQVVPLFRAWPTHFVLGNVDADEGALAGAIAAAGLTFHVRRAELALEGRRIAVLHGDDAVALRAAIEGQQYDLVCCGHTHRPELRQEGRTRVLNPGALYRASPRTLAIVDWPSGDVRFLELRLESR